MSVTIYSDKSIEVEEYIRDNFSTEEIATMTKWMNHSVATDEGYESWQLYQNKVAHVEAQYQVNFSNSNFKRIMGLLGFEVDWNGTEIKLTDIGPRVINCLNDPFMVMSEDAEYYLQALRSIQTVINHSDHLVYYA